MQKTELTNAVLLLQKLKLGDDEVADKSCLVVQPVDGEVEDGGEGGQLGTVDYCLEIGENRPRLPAVYERQRVAVMHSIFPLY